MLPVTIAGCGETLTKHFPAMNISIQAMSRSGPTMAILIEALHLFAETMASRGKAMTAIG